MFQLHFAVSNQRIVIVRSTAIQCSFPAYMVVDASTGQRGVNVSSPSAMMALISISGITGITQVTTLSSHSIRPAKYMINGDRDGRTHTLASESGTVEVLFTPVFQSAHPSRNFSQFTRSG
jgi:hypothetical protein